jgi:hypothetical protein
MAVEQGYSKIVTQGLKFAYDVGDTRNSYTGRPTTNISAGIGMSTYNNVPGSVSSTLTGTGTYYRGAEIIRQDLTALDGSGASWLSGGNNPGIGVVTGGGGGTGGRYTGHSIFFKPTVPMHGNPIYTNYSNIGGWQSSTEYDDMGDGWFRARVIWYDSVTRSDGKYWAINPASTPSGATVTIYWAGPFKEDLNVTNVSQYINGTRSSTQGLIDASGKGNTMSLSDVSFDSSVFPQITFDGTNDYIDISSFAPGSNSTGTISAMVYPTQNSADAYVMGVGGNTTYGASRAIRVNGGYWSTVSYGSSTEDFNSIVAAPLNTWQHVAFVWNGTTVNFYHNGVLYTTTKSGMVNFAGDKLSIGRPPWGPGSYWQGKINTAQVYDRALSESEILQNHNHYRTRFNLPGVVYNYNESTRADLYTGYWNNSTTYTMADFGGIPNVTAHGWSSGPATYTLTLPSLPTHTKVRYKVYWHLVDSLDNETNQLFIMNSSGGETEILRFTKQYNLTPSISIAASPGTYTWSGAKTYTYRPWAGGTYGADGYIIVDSGWVDHTASSFTARHVLGADQGQSDEAEYLSHVEVQLYG